MTEYHDFEVVAHRASATNVEVRVPEAQLLQAITDMPESIEAISSEFRENGITLNYMRKLADLHSKTMCQLVMKLLWDSNLAGFLYHHRGKYQAANECWVDEDNDTTEFGWTFTWRNRHVADTFEQLVDNIGELQENAVAIPGKVLAR